MRGGRHGRVLPDRGAGLRIGLGAPPPPPPGPPGAGPVAVAFSPPDAGWIDLSLGSRDKEAQLAISYLCNSFAAMLDWLLAVGRAKDARLTIDQEGVFGHLDATAAAPGFVRLTVRQQVEGDEAAIVALDAEPARTALLRAFRDGVATFWDKPTRDEFWDAWFWYGYPEWREDNPDWPGPGVDWGRLDALLADA